jgi:DNA polymerase
MSDFYQRALAALRAQREVFGDALYAPFALPAPGGTGDAVTPIVRDDDAPYALAERAADDDSPSADRADQPRLDGVDPRGDAFDADSLDDFEKRINQCKKCRLGASRNKFVFGEGNPNADVMAIGEGPGRDEDEQGRPFVGRAGKLLNDILKAIDFEREDVFIGNVVKCRPPGNRTPASDEMDACLPYLNKQIELIKPKLILCLGKTAARGLLKLNDSLGKMREKTHRYGDATVVVTYHPAALLRNPGWKRGCWEDVQKLRKLYDDLPSA